MVFDDASVPPTRKPETSEYLVGRPIDWSHWTPPDNTLARAPMSIVHRPWAHCASAFFRQQQRFRTQPRCRCPTESISRRKREREVFLSRSLSLSVPSLALSACCDLRTKSQSFASLELAAAVGGVISALSFARSDILSPSLHNSKRNFIASYQVATFANLLGRRRRPTSD